MSYENSCFLRIILKTKKPRTNYLAIQEQQRLIKTQDEKHQQQLEELKKEIEALKKNR